jgi:hypothetical protein
MQPNNPKQYDPTVMRGDNNPQVFNIPNNSSQNPSNQPPQVANNFNANPAVTSVNQANTFSPPPAGFVQQNQFNQPITSSPLQPLSPNQSQPPVMPIGSNAQKPEENKQVKASAQSSLLISEIRDDLVVMQDGTFRAIVECKSINFDLMSEKEKEGVEYTYQSFINSLNFNIQILIRSQKVDLGPYINKLIDIQSSQDNLLLNELMKDYINFIDELSTQANIMSKTFFVIVSYEDPSKRSNAVAESKGFFSSLFSSGEKQEIKIDTVTMDRAKEELRNRISLIMSGLIQLGIQCNRLSTAQLGELFYNFYNPDTAIRQPLKRFKDQESLYVRKSDKRIDLYSNKDEGMF